MGKCMVDAGSLVLVDPEKSQWESTIPLKVGFCAGGTWVVIVWDLSGDFQGFQT